MPLLIQMQWPKFGYKRATLFGKGKVPISLTNLGPLCILRFDIRHVEAFRDFLEANVNLEDFLAANAPVVRHARKLAESKARKEAKEWGRQDVDYWKDAYHRKAEEAARYSGENIKMSYAIDVLSAQRAAALDSGPAKVEGTANQKENDDAIR